MNKRGNQHYTTSPNQDLYVCEDIPSILEEDTFRPIDVTTVTLATTPVPPITPVMPRPITPVTPIVSACPKPSSLVKPCKISSSKKKITQSRKLYAETRPNNKRHPDSNILNRGFHLVDINLLSSALTQFVQYKYCGGKDCFTIGEDITARRGLCTNLVFNCNECKLTYEFSNSKVSDFGAEVNLRYVYGLRTIGRGQKPGKMLCSVMGLPSPPTKFGPIYEQLGTALKSAAEKSMKVAVKEMVDLNEEENIPTDFFL